MPRWSAIGNFQVRAFAAAEHAGGIAPRSIQRRLSAVRTFYEFLMREGHAEHNPAREVRAPKIKKRLPATLDADQMARLLEFRADDSLSARDKAMMELFYSSGLRLSELVGLRSRRRRFDRSNRARARQGQQNRASCPWGATPSRQ